MDEQRWQQLWQALDLRPPLLVFEALQASYAEPQRAYHNSEHIRFCLQQLDEVRTQLTEPWLVELALWFHDAIYDPQATDNEARSAAWAMDVLQQADATPRWAQRIHELILATTHTHPASDADMALLLDIDLAILGQPTDKFDLYEVAIRQEYAWVPLDRYVVGRSQVLQNFLNRPQIYTSPYFHQRYEQQARDNLARSLSNLAQLPR